MTGTPKFPSMFSYRPDSVPKAAENEEIKQNPQGNLKSALEGHVPIMEIELSQANDNLELKVLEQMRVDDPVKSTHT